MRIAIKLDINIGGVNSDTETFCQFKKFLIASAPI
jgi:hypothetical protein